MVVDHEVEVSDEVARVLRTWGCEVECASDAREALEMVPQYDPQVVIADAALPSDGCIRLLRILRCEIPDVSLVVMTNSGRNAGDVVMHPVTRDFALQDSGPESRRHDELRLRPQCRGGGEVRRLCRGSQAA